MRYGGQCYGQHTNRSCHHSTLLALVYAALLAFAGCAGPRLNTRADAVNDVISKARTNGAMLCAPVELAMAESHYDFARTEMSEGDYYRAKEELGIAENNANEALALSPQGRCTKTKKVAATDDDPDGDGILNSVDDCPLRPEDMDSFKDGDGCPDLDNDQDGLADTVDECPDKAEDKDGFQDVDGCPDLDNDEDGLSDRIDQCPDKPEDNDGFEDDDGCPDCDNDGDGVLECPQAIDKCPDVPAKTPDGCPKKYTNVVITKTKIEIKQTVYFDTNKATIKQVSYSLLNEVAQALKDNAKIQVQVQGHTDSRGRNNKNLRLSDARAASVRDYLVAQGVDVGRLTSKGFGEEVPISDNRTKRGREQNRRVEFVITGR